MWSHKSSIAVLVSWPRRALVQVDHSWLVLSCQLRYSKPQVRHEDRMQHLHYPSPGLGTFLTHIASQKFKMSYGKSEVVSVTESNDESRA